MFKLDLPPDPKVQAKIDAARARESARMTRIMNPRVRQMGKDITVLDAQVAERDAHRADDRHVTDQYGSELNRQDRILQLLSRRQEEDVRALNKAEVEFRAQNQGKQTGSAWDLNDPEALKNEESLPGVDQEVDDTRLGVSSMQYFEGEDALMPARKELQKQQMREWTKGQAGEKAARHAQAAAQKRLEEQVIAAQVSATTTVDQMMATRRKDVHYAVQAENGSLIEATKAKKAQAAEEEQKQNYVDVMNTYNSKLLGDDPMASYTSDGRIAHPKDFKGFPEEQLAQIFNDQRMQEVEMAQRRAAEQQQFNEYAAAEAIASRQAELAERATARARKQLNRDTVSTNLTTIRASGPVYKNEIGQGFFSQFGTSSR